MKDDSSVIQIISSSQQQVINHLLLLPDSSTGVASQLSARDGSGTSAGVVSTGEETMEEMPPKKQNLKTHPSDTKQCFEVASCKFLVMEENEEDVQSVKEVQAGHTG